MCGLYGWILNDAPKQKIERLAMSLPILNTERGRDSWGVYLPDADKIVKAVGVITNNGIDVIARRATVLGHTRQASQGAITKQNAHPFRFGNVIGAHNGVLWNHDELNEKHARAFEVDSMHIFAHLADRKDMSDIQGSGAIWWYQDERVHFTRFGGHLSVAGIEQNGKGLGVVFSSEQRHLDVALRLARFEYFEYELEDRKHYWVGKDGKLYVQGKVDIAKRVSTLETLLEVESKDKPITPITFPAMPPARELIQSRQSGSKDKTPTNRSATYTIGNCDGCHNVTAIYPAFSAGHIVHLCRACLYADRSARLKDEVFGVDGV